MPSPSSVSTLDRIVPIGKPGLVMMPTSMPRSSLPSKSITCRYRASSRSVLNRCSDGRSSASTTAMMSGSTPPDHPGGHPGARLVDGFLGQFDPADPTCSPVGDDLDVLRGVFGLSVEATAVLAQPRPAR